MTRHRLALPCLRAWAIVLGLFPLLLAGLLLGTPTPARAAPPRVEAFDLQTWPQLLTAPGARVVVFTSTDCHHCPAVIEQLARHIAQAPKAQRPQLIAVVMDLAPGEDDAALLNAPHYRPSTRLMAFQGQSAALRHSVNPQWRGITPYVGLIKPGQAGPAVQWVMGMPEREQLQAWLPAHK